MTDKEYLEKYLPKEKIAEGLKKLKNNIPPQYIVGNVDFYDVNLLVNENVLIPRFETELLVEKTINYAKQYFQNKIDLLDIATGSGNIAITLKKHLNAKVVASDISIKALEIAKKNAQRNKQEITFIQSDMLDKIKGKFDIIISNPPYVSTEDPIDEIVKNNEPHLALYAKEDGLYYYKKILQEIKPYLKEKSLIAFEIGYKQSEKITNFIKQYLPDAIFKTKKDLTGKDRFIFIFQNLA